MKTALDEILPSYDVDHARHGSVGLPLSGFPLQLEYFRQVIARQSVPEVVREHPHPVPALDGEASVGERFGQPVDGISARDYPEATPVPVRLQRGERVGVTTLEGRPCSEGGGVLGQDGDDASRSGKGRKSCDHGPRRLQVHQNPVAEHRVERLPAEYIPSPFPRAFDETHPTSNLTTFQYEPPARFLEHLLRGIEDGYLVTIAEEWDRLLA